MRANGWPSFDAERGKLVDVVDLPVRDQRLRLVDGVVLAKRMAHELLIKEDAPHVGVALELDPEHVPDLALGPVGACPGCR